MTEVGNAPRGTFRCGCGVRVVATADGAGSCMALAENGTGRCRMRPYSESAVFDISLCKLHYKGYLDVLRLMNEGRLVEPTREFAEQVREWRRSRSGDYDAARERANAVVYYIRIGDRIKIGWTGDFPARMQSLMPDDILAIEPGSMALERDRQKEFRHLQIVGERFQIRKDLLDHIARVRTEHGVPPSPSELHYLWRPPWGTAASG